MHTVRNTATVQCAAAACALCLDVLCHAHQTDPAALSNWFQRRNRLRVPAFNEHPGKEGMGLKFFPHGPIHGFENVKDIRTQSMSWVGNRNRLLKASKCFQLAGVFLF